MSPDEFYAAANVSRETFERLKIFDGLLLEWSRKLNLIARSTIKDRWRRHFLDSVQLLTLAPPTAQNFLDLGSGAGFPGLVLAAALTGPTAKITLIESRKKKAAFLSAATAAMELDNVAVISERIEAYSTARRPDVITARALANLNKTLGYAFGLAGENTKLLLHKGQDVEGELTDAAKYWHMDVIRHNSISRYDGVILEIGNLAPCQRA